MTMSIPDSCLCLSRHNSVDRVEWDIRECSRVSRQSEVVVRGEE